MPIMSLLVDRAYNVLNHYSDDLHVWDKETLNTKVKSNQDYLWIVHNCGTHLARFDIDNYPNSKKSHLECLIRAGIRGSWPTSKAYIFSIVSIHEIYGPMGHISDPISFQSLTQLLPRPKPRVILPGESQEVYSACFGFVGIA